VTPVHFYSPIPTLGEVDPRQSTKIQDCHGLDFQRDEQLRRLREEFPRYLEEFQPEANGGLARVDAFVLYATIREHRPALVVEVGAGESTKVILAALERNRAEGTAGRLTSIDPYPPAYLPPLRGPHFTLLQAKVQDVPDREFLDADLLFIDSSHVSKFGSDVNHEMLHLVPRTKVGTLVHWHDIMIPQDYPIAWLNKGTFWNESYLLQAFLAFNDTFRTVWAARYMQVREPEALRRAFPFFAPDDPAQQLSSYWVKRVR
jgi:hypothetical protein